VRIEGKEKTLFEGPILTEGHQVQAASDTGPRPCDATNNHAHPEPMPTPTAAAADAMELTGQGWDGNWFDGFDDYYLTRFGPDHEDLTAGQYWGVLVDGAFTSVGGCQYGDRAGDEVLWAYDAFSGRRFLWLAAAGDTTVAPRAPLPTAYVEVGQPLGVLVESYEGGGSPAARAEGVTVAPVATDPVNGEQTVEVGDPEAVVTDSEGAAELTFATPGWHRIKAQEEAGFIRSNRLDVCVEPEGGGGCGPLPADAQLRTPSRYEEGPEGGEEEPPTGGDVDTPKPSGGEATSPDSPRSQAAAASPATPTNAISVSRATADRKRGTSTLIVTVPGPGHLALSGKEVLATSLDTAAAGTVELTIRPKARQRRTLRRRGKLRVAVKVTFTPTGGAPASTWHSVLLRAKK
jgi:hypothetical protein